VIISTSYWDYLIFVFVCVHVYNSHLNIHLLFRPKSVKRAGVTYLPSLDGGPLHPIIGRTKTNEETRQQEETSTIPSSVVM